ncbi:beta-microseminoprotein-like [Lingula anatina]|uniref:Beta-microseminoprotein-like n=1 Tax=Lingula anatina TaxID=7574 RepID=A0A1S3K742_LINAN|nr:beta-microseminoprotein-like [Lingula anatina]|eukprot:XP_013418448.1 beta-microseminoprotein-like [Lingula anatina]
MNSTFCLLAGTILAILTYYGAQGYCMAGMSKQEVKATDDGKLDVVTYCEYKGIRIEVNATKETDDCFRCTCSERYMSCCGYGIHAGVIMPAAGCKIVTGADGCKPLHVKVDDETKDCFSGESVIGK